MSEKTQQPTPKKLQDARKKGQVPRSRLFSSAAVTLGGLGATLLFADDSARRFMEWTRSLLVEHDTSPAIAMQHGVQVLVRCSLPSLVGALLSSMLVSVVTVGGLTFQADAVAPKLDKLNFVEGFKKLVSLRQVVDVLKGLAVAATIFWLFWKEVSANAGLAGTALRHEHGFVALLFVLRPLIVKASVVLMLLGVADWALAKRRHLKDLMMSHEDVKQEHKNSEGDPHQKSKRKALQKQLASGGGQRGVQKATAVVVNPTHLAVALRYDESESDAPYIVAKARDEEALALRSEASSLGIPVLRDIPLARSLIHYDVGEEVPEELYQAAAAILKVALEQKEQS